jgi:hypothetical protein
MKTVHKVKIRNIENKIHISLNVKKSGSRLPEKSTYIFSI